MKKFYKKKEEIPPLIREYIETISNEKLNDISLDDINGFFSAMEKHYERQTISNDTRESEEAKEFCCGIS